MKRLKTIFLLLCLPIMLTAKEYYVATNGDDANTGSIDSPFATLARAQAEVKARRYSIYPRREIYHGRVANYGRKRKNLRLRIPDGQKRNGQRTPYLLLRLSG